MSNKYKVRKTYYILQTPKKRFYSCRANTKGKGIYDRYVAWHGAAGKFHTPPGSDRNAAHMSSAFCRGIVNTFCDSNVTSSRSIQK